MVEVDITETTKSLHKITNQYATPTIARLFKHFIKHGPQTDAELKFFIAEYLHFHVPDVAICHNHSHPFKMVSDLYFERVKSVFGFANRGGGKTQDIALLNFLDAFFKGVEVVSAGATLSQAGLCYDYFLNIWNEPLINNTVMIQRSVQSETVLALGGKVSIVAGTAAGMNGPHPCKARIDEVELMQWGVLQEGLSMSQTVKNKKGKFIGQDVLTSTRKKESGTVSRLIKEAKKRNIVVNTWCLWESIEKCEHDCHNFHKTHQNDPEFKHTKQCPLYETYNLKGESVLLCGGVAHNAAGFIPVEEAIRKTQLLDRGTIDLQWLCKKGVSDAAVYKDFYAAEVHEMTYSDFKNIMKRRAGDRWQDYINNNMRTVGGIDFGANHATLIALKDFTAPLPTFYFIDEHYTTPEQEVLNEDHVKQIKALDYYKKGMVFWADYAQRQDILEFRTYGLNVHEADKAVFAGIDYCKALMQRRGIHKVPHFYVISDRCPKLAEQLLLYSHPKKDDGTIDKDKLIIQQDDHAPDAARYCVYSDKMKPTGYKTSKARI